MTLFWMHNFEYQNIISTVTFRISIFWLSLFSFYHGQKSSLAFWMLPNIRFSISKLTLNARSWISKRYFDIRISIFNIRIVTVFHVIMVKTFFGIQTITNYQISDFKTHFYAQTPFWYPYFDFLYSDCPCFSRYYGQKPTLGFVTSWILGS